MMQQQQAMAGGGAPMQDNSKLFQAEWEALEVAAHRDALAEVRGF